MVILDKFFVKIGALDPKILSFWGNRPHFRVRALSFREGIRLPKKTSMTMENHRFNREYIFKCCFFHCHVSFPRRFHIYRFKGTVRLALLHEQPSKLARANTSQAAQTRALNGNGILSPILIYLKNNNSCR